jgi:GTP cyclohydrolase IB
MPDTQSVPDTRHLPIARVGIRKLRYPLHISMGPQPQHTVGEWDMSVALPADKKGTHMSRFVAWLDRLTQADGVNPDTPPPPSGQGLGGSSGAEYEFPLNQIGAVPLTSALLSEKFADMLTLLDAENGRVEVKFPFFIRKRAPVSGATSLLEYRGGWTAESAQDRTTVWTWVRVPVKSLCPCSKEISSYGAHNQRSHVRIEAELLQEVSWHELVRFAERAASSEIWPMLKRADEKWVTEQAYDNPKFVEDLVRDVALQLQQDVRIGHYRVEVENFESIHNHSAYAVIESDPV